MMSPLCFTCNLLIRNLLILLDFEIRLFWMLILAFQEILIEFEEKNLLRWNLLGNMCKFDGVRKGSKLS